jgi:hypothetical protein
MRRILRKVRSHQGGEEVFMSFVFRMSGDEVNPLLFLWNRQLMQTTKGHYRNPAIFSRIFEGGSLFRGNDWY